MLRNLFALSLAFVILGCKKDVPEKAPPPSPPPASSPEFDKQWTALARTGVEALYIEDDRGQGLMGNVRRATSMAPALTGTAAQPAAAAVLPEQPSGEDVERIIKQNLAAVKGCYLLTVRQGTPRSGKAIVSFQIGADGQVAEVKVDAPVFSDTSLPRCVSTQVGRWSFPKSQKGGPTMSYPFVFVGG